jgi:hypothetical protein
MLSMRGFKPLYAVSFDRNLLSTLRRKFVRLALKISMDEEMARRSGT